MGVLITKVSTRGDLVQMVLEGDTHRWATVLKPEVARKLGSQLQKAAGLIDHLENLDPYVVRETIRQQQEKQLAKWPNVIGVDMATGSSFIVAEQVK